jgi:hypothetical protein
LSGKKEKPPVLADWEVTLTYEGGKMPVPASSWRRDKSGGYTFRGAAGIVADFAPGVVLHVRRVDAPAGPGPAGAGK